MKTFQIFSVVVIFFIFLGCGARQEKKVENTDTLNKQTVDYEKYDEFKANSADSITIDTLKKREVDTIKKVTEEPKTKKKETTKKRTKKKSKDQDTIKVYTESKDGTLKRIKTADAEAKATKRYYVIGGTYKKLESAKKQDDLFKSKGYHSQILPKVNVYHRVAVASGKTKESIVTEIKRIRSSNKDMKFWVLCR